MFSRLGHIGDRYFITLVFVVLGWVNAESWPYLLVFVAFGATIDIWLVKPNPIVPQQALSDEQKLAVRKGWNSLLFIVLGTGAIALTISIVNAGIARKIPETIQSMGPALYQWVSPFIVLLRLHYGDLAAHGFVDRANLVAFVYSELFLLFYVGLAIWLVRFRNSRVMDHPRIETAKLRKQRLSCIFLLVVLPLCLLWTVHLTAWVSIDYNDHSFGRRHINTNLAQYNSFFFNLAFALGAFGFITPVVHLIARMMPLVFARGVRKVERAT